MLRNRETSVFFFPSQINNWDANESSPKGKLISFFPGIFHSFVARARAFQGTPHPQSLHPLPLGMGLCILNFPPEFCLLLESSRRAYRRCSAQGTWLKRENGTGIWQDDSECSEDHKAKQDVSLSSLLMGLLGPNHLLLSGQPAW